MKGIISTSIVWILETIAILEASGRAEIRPSFKVFSMWWYLRSFQLSLLRELLLLVHDQGSARPCVIQGHA